ncbi:hypothetical protein FRY74_00685 [Vicingus serpentipes]|uniref:Transporter n=1 Tax=Vicingus serpentipes TaxID=1926625 RepID=A0A5C6RZD2_9FLAO|nr:hypothetical protein [Vicingus serpentipes]TXB66732.1 hypothetical protein FRY74_00685 [Vicingus serpentipes]
MNRKITFLLLLLFVGQISWACDLCSFYIGIQPNDFKSSFGIRYRYRLFEDKYTFNSSTNTISNKSSQRLANNNLASINHIDESYLGTEKKDIFYKEQYNSYDFLLNIALGKRFNLLISNSFSDNYVYKNDSLIDNISGVGDMQLLLNYRLFYSKVSNDSLAKNRFLHRLTIGAGIELPTGSYNKNSTKSYETTITGNTILGQPLMVLDPHLQPGTGSLNYLFFLEYLVQFNQLGWNSNISYKLTTKNKNGFQFANRSNFNTSLFYMAKIKPDFILMPNAGLSYEYSERDTQNEIEEVDSGGEALFATPGFKLLVKNIAFDFNYYHPIHDYLYGNQPSNKARIIGQLTYNF